MGISVWIRDRPQREFLGTLPPEVELNVIPREGPLPSAARDAEFLVPPFNDRAILELLADMPALRVVQAISAGVDWLLPWVPDGVSVCTARGTRDNAVAEWVLAVIMAMEKHLPHFARRQAEHDWHHELLGELTGKRVLIVGLGSIGRLVGAKLSALGMRVSGVASTSRAGVHSVQELPSLLPAADVVVVLVPLTTQTQRLFDEATLSCLRAGALLVNASRGGVVDTDALTRFVADGRLRAALDVADPEPLPPDHPLWDMPGVLITPHLAGDSPEAEERVYRLVGDQIRRYAEGKPLLNLVGGSSPSQASPSESAARNRKLWDERSAEYQATHGGQLQASGGAAWGVWQLPESELQVLGEVRDRDVLELGCGAAQWSIALHGLGAHVTGLDNSSQQLAHARALMASAGTDFPLVHASAEATGLPDSSFDIVFCDHGAMSFADPYATIPEVTRLLRPGGLLAFSMHTPILEVAWRPEAEHPEDRLLLDYWQLRAIEEPGEPISYQLPYGTWIRLFKENGLLVEDLLELRPSDDATSSYRDDTDREWALRWPMEHIWRLRRAPSLVDA